MPENVVGICIMRRLADLYYAAGVTEQKVHMYIEEKEGYMGINQGVQGVKELNICIYNNTLTQ